MWVGIGSEAGVTQLARRTTAGRLRQSGRGMGIAPDIGDDAVLIHLSLQHCPHLRAAPVEVMTRPDQWLVLPLLIAAQAPLSPGYALLAAPPARSVAVVTFLQLCGRPLWRTVFRDPLRHLASGRWMSARTATALLWRLR